MPSFSLKTEQFALLLEDTASGTGKESGCNPFKRGALDEIWTLSEGWGSAAAGWSVRASDANAAGQPRLSFPEFLEDGNFHLRPSLYARDGERHICAGRLSQKLPDGAPDCSALSVLSTVWSE